MGLKGLVIIADDLTGAMDSSGHFAGQGLSTTILLERDYSSDAEVVAVTTDSRAEDPKTARNRVQQVMKKFSGRIIYKKIDSTLRGNIGVELEAVLENRKYDKVLVAPAFPAMGRTTENGVLLVNGTPVAETSFAYDPVLPVRESHIPTLLEQTMDQRVTWVGIDENEASPESFFRHVSRLSQRIVVCDVKHQSHFSGIVRATVLAGENWLLCGSSGLAREMHLLVEKDRTSRLQAVSGNLQGALLVVVGSRNPISGKQLEFAQDAVGLPIFNVNVECLSREDWTREEMEKILETARLTLPKKRRLALSTTFSSYQPDLKHSLPGFLADATEIILTEQRISGLFLSGGDIAVEVCRRLKVPALSVCGEIEPGIPAGMTVGNREESMRVVTKAGGFGQIDTLVKSIHYLEKGEIS